MMGRRLGAAKPYAWMGLLFAFTFIFSEFAQAQLVRNFTVRFEANAKGDILLIGNTLASCTQAVPPAVPAPPATCEPSVPLTGEGSPRTNGGYNMGPVNTAGGTTSSSSATLALPPGSDVLWAGLYWSARFPVGQVCNNTAAAACRRVKFATPGGAYVTKTGSVDVAANSAYQGFVDVTADVQAGGSGAYRAADAVAATGQDLLGFWAGWSLVVVVQDPAQPLRNLTVFDGFGIVDTNTPVTASVSGFLTPLAGAFTTRMGAVAYDGDLDSGGDSLQLDNTTLSNALNPAADFFNSSITRLGTRLTAKNPDFANQLGLDIDVVDASGVIPNGATDATLMFSTTDETVYPGVLTFAIDVFEPVVEGNISKTVTDINGGAVAANDILEYTVTLSNAGSDASINLVLTDPIPTNATYVPGSLRITAGANAGVKTDAGGDDQAEFTGSSVKFRLGTGANAAQGGRLGINESTTLKFRVQIKPAVATGTSISNQATITYKGETLGTPFTSLSDGNPSVAGAQPTVVTVGTARAELTISKTNAPNPLAAGGILTYTLAVKNAGPSNANLTVQDPVPANTTFRSASAPAGWNVTKPAVGGSGTVVFTNPSLPPGAYTLTMVVQVKPGTAVGTVIRNTATLTSPNDPTPPPPASTTAQVLDLIFRDGFE